MIKVNFNPITGWYVVRKIKTGVAIPGNVVENRAAARILVNQKTP